MTIIIRALILIISWISLSAVSQIFIKKGISDCSIGTSEFSIQNLVVNGIQSKYLIFGCFLYTLSMLAYFGTLSKFELHHATAIGGGLTIGLIALLAYLILGEKISYVTWIGIFLVIMGIIVIGLGNDG